MDNSVFTRGSVPYIDRIERQILVHSLIYYKMDSNIVSDSFFDEISSNLANCIKEFPDNFKKSKYVKTFKKFDGSTGADLEYDTEEINSIALYLIGIQDDYTKKDAN